MSASEAARRAARLAADAAMDPLHVRPLDLFTSIKVKFGVVILAAIGVTLAVVTAGVRLGVPVLVSGLAAGVLAIAMVRFLARGMTSPLREMALASRAMGRGDYSHRVTETSRDEVGALARTFNRMAADLAEVDQFRRDLVANASHELRTPISALQAVLENLVDGVEQPDADTFRTMLAQVERLGRLVSQLLDLSRLESGAVPLERAPFDVRAVLQQAVDELRLHERDVRLVVDVRPEDLVADGDAERVHQVVANLLENAVRHSPPGGRVLASGHRNGSGVVLSVDDDGPGIPDAERTKVFERFYRADAARSSRGGGSGLGLAIARWIVDLHGGHIRAEQREPAGCRIVVELPASDGKVSHR